MVYAEFGNYHLDVEPKMCKSDLALEKSEAGAPEAEIEVTSEMIEAGLDTLYEFDITEPREAEMRKAVTEVYRTMVRTGPTSFVV